jgi:hypothetical protein
MKLFFLSLLSHFLTQFIARLAMLIQQALMKAATAA